MKYIDNPGNVSCRDYQPKTEPMDDYQPKAEPMEHFQPKEEPMDPETANPTTEQRNIMLMTTDDLFCNGFFRDPLAQIEVSSYCDGGGGYGRKGLRLR